MKINTQFAIALGLTQHNMALEYEVERILAHMTTIFGHYYLVKWADYSEAHNFWNEQEYMPEQMVNAYRLERNLEPISTPSKAQSTSDENSEPPTNNFVSPDVVVRTINSKRAMCAYKDPTIDVIHYFGQPLNMTSKMVLILLYQGHYFVIAINTQGTPYMADGVNNCHDNLELDWKLYQALGIKKFNKLEYKWQQYEDHCGASAVMIALEFIRILKSNGQMTDEEIQPPTKLTLDIIKRLHPYKSTVDKTHDAAGVPINLRDARRRKCNNCNKYFPKRQTLLQHEAKCNATNKMGGGAIKDINK